MMSYNTLESFVREYGVRKFFYCDYFKKQEYEGKTKTEIQADVIRNELVKSPQVLNREYKFYEDVKDKIDWIDK
tara:strand:- start:19 stop:240 length:222 start_codon:yes stop_codon:yes gene_type:complete